MATGIVDAPDAPEIEPRLLAQADEEDEGGGIALVTGGGRRLGRRLALALASEGYDVAVSYHDSEEGAMAVVDELGELGVRAAAFHADLAKVADCNSLVERVEDELGPLSLLVNNAAVFPHAPAEDADARVFDHTMAVNLRAPYLLALEAGRRMQERGEGSIVNIASVGGLRPYTKHVPYSLSKAGVVMLTRLLSLSFAPEVTVNAIAPGTIWMEGEEEGAAAKPPEESIPLGSYGDSADIEEALLYLAGAPFVTGQVLVVDGGASVRYLHP